MRYILSQYVIYKEVVRQTSQILSWPLVQTLYPVTFWATMLDIKDQINSSFISGISYQHIVQFYYRRYQFYGSVHSGLPLLRVWGQM